MIERLKQFDAFLDTLTERGWCVFGGGALIILVIITGLIEGSVPHG